MNNLSATDTNNRIEAILAYCPDAVNLLSNKYADEHRERFEAYKEKIKGFSTLHPDGTKAGDILLFYNGNDVKLIAEVLGFDADGEAYMLWDCYWAPIRLTERLIQNISKENYEPVKFFRLKKVIPRLLLACYKSPSAQYRVGE